MTQYEVWLKEPEKSPHWARVAMAWDDAPEQAWECVRESLKLNGKTTVKVSSGEFLEIHKCDGLVLNIGKNNVVIVEVEEWTY